MATKKKPEGASRFFALYNSDTREVLYEREVALDALVTDRVKDHPEPDDLLAPYTEQELTTEAICRGSPWKVYAGDVAFSWDAVTIKVAAE